MRKRKYQLIKSVFDAEAGSFYYGDDSGLVYMILNKDQFGGTGCYVNAKKHPLWFIEVCLECSHPQCTSDDHSYRSTCSAEKCHGHYQDNAFDSMIAKYEGWIELSREAMQKALDAKDAEIAALKASRGK